MRTADLVLASAMRPELCCLPFRIRQKARGARAPFGAVSGSFTRKPFWYCESASRQRAHGVFCPRGRPNKDVIAGLGLAISASTSSKRPSARPSRPASQRCAKGCSSCGGACRSACPWAADSCRTSGTCRDSAAERRNASGKYRLARCLLSDSSDAPAHRLLAEKQRALSSALAVDLHQHAFFIASNTDHSPLPSDAICTLCLGWVVRAEIRRTC